jgi:predicted ATPase
MIKSLGLKNFKSIKKKHFPLRNLNLLLGLNGMGKSSFIQSLLLLRQSDRLSHGELKLNGHYVKLGNTKDALYQYSKQEDLAISIEFEGAENEILEFQYQTESDIFKLKATLRNITTGLQEKFSKQALFGNNFQYLNANRLDPVSLQNKNYSSVVIANNVGNHGEFTAHFIEVYGNDEVKFENLLHKDSKIKDLVTNKEILNKTLINQINLWMGEISPGVNIRTTSIPNTESILLEYVYKQPNFGNTNRYKPINVGFGISYALPVVTALLAAKPGELIIIENPESHIHPRGQAELGKLISLVSMNDVQVIVEAHSDHILNGIRVAVKENPELRKKVNLFYFNKVVSETEQYSKIQEIEIDKNGELSDYPENLLDEWSNQLTKLV